MKKRNSIDEHDDKKKNNVLHDVHDDYDNRDIVDDNEKGNQVHEDIKYVDTGEEKQCSIVCHHYDNEKMNMMIMMTTMIMKTTMMTMTKIMKIVIMFMMMMKS